MFGEDYFEERKRKAKKAEEEAKQKEEEHAAYLEEEERRRKRIREQREREYQGRLAKVKEDLKEAGFLQAEGNFTSPEHFSHFNTNIRRQYIGDKDYAVKFNGEGTKLLFEVKEQMKFRKLGRFKAIRNFTDGTVITATSVYGNDFIRIDVTKSAETIKAAGAMCDITFIDPPAVMPPMVPGELQEGDEDGQQYWKMYYSYNIADCPKCEETLEWTFTFNFVAPEGTYIDHYDDEPENRCVMSADRGCSGELISTGIDDDGTYIIFKVYTESSNHNRSGHGYVQIKAEGKDKETSEVICLETHIAQVRCCERNDLEQPEIYWENWQWANCDRIYYGYDTELCEVRDLIPLSHLLMYAAGESGHAGRFYALPEIGGCLPYDWSLEGPGRLEPGDYDINNVGLHRMATYYPEADYMGCEDVIIKVRDECGGEDFFRASCCNAPQKTPLGISYTSLIMGCSQSQDLEVTGGCGPYQWSLSGGGTLTVLSEFGNRAQYDSPATNPNCVNNATVTVTDCCGDSAQVQIAVNCWFVGGALMVCEQIPCWDGCPSNWNGYMKIIYYNCDGTIFMGPSCFCSTGFGVVNCASPCPNACGLYACPCCWCANCGASGCGIYDVRTAAMKAGGCCPLNPYTGLPYD